MPIFTISGTTIIIILAMTISTLLLANNIQLKNISIFIFFSAVVVVAIAIIPNNYILHQFLNFYDGGLSWVGKYGSSLGPIIMVGRLEIFLVTVLEAHNLIFKTFCLKNGESF